MKQVLVMEEDKKNIISNLVQEAMPNAAEEPPKLEPLLTLPGFILEGWKDAIYGKDGTGSTSADNAWTQESERINSTR